VAPLATEFESIRDGRRRVVPIVVRPDISEGAIHDLWQVLDDIAWSSLSHAYGPAGDVPPLLLAASVGTDEVRGLAWWELWGNVHHQGTVYEATLPSVPFIDAIAQWHGHQDRVQAIAFLRQIALADGTFSARVRDAVRLRAQRLIWGYSEEPELVQRALSWLATAYPDLAIEHRDLIRLVPSAMQVTWNEVVGNSVNRVDLDDDATDRQDELERWALAGWSTI
jgi:hypothetical protein